MKLRYLKLTLYCMSPPLLLLVVALLARRLRPVHHISRAPENRDVLLALLEPRVDDAVLPEVGTAVVGRVDWLVREDVVQLVDGEVNQVVAQYLRRVGDLEDLGELLQLRLQESVEARASRLAVVHVYRHDEAGKRRSLLLCGTPETGRGASALLWRAKS